jgi:hypothetical protein
MKFQVAIGNSREVFFVNCATIAGERQKHLLELHSVFVAFFFGSDFNFLKCDVYQLVPLHRTTSLSPASSDISVIN